MLHTESAALRIIYTSGYSPDFAGGTLKLTPRVNFLAKPYTSTGVLEIVERALTASKAERP